MRQILLATFAAFCIPLRGVAQSDNIADRLFMFSNLALLQGVILQIDDQVNGKCWTNSANVRAKVQLILEQSDIPVFSLDTYVDGPMVPEVRLSGLGLRNGNRTCAVNAELSVRMPVTHIVNSKASNLQADEPFLLVLSDDGVSFWERNSIFMSADNSDLQMLGFFEAAVSEFAADFIALKRVYGVQEYRELIAPTIKTREEMENELNSVK